VESVYWPTAQGAHASAPAAATNWPRAHSSHAEAPWPACGAANCPATQSVQLDAPVPAMVPAWHKLHALAPCTPCEVRLLNLPSSQSLQERLSSSALYCPSGQVTHEVLSEWAYLPAGQAEQAVASSSATYSPDAQGKQESNPAAWVNLPAGHVSHDVLRPVLNLPPGHVEHPLLPVSLS